MLIKKHIFSNTRGTKVPIVSINILNSHENWILRSILVEFESISERITDILQEITTRSDSHRVVKMFESGDLLRLDSVYNKRIINGKKVFIPSISYGVSIYNVSTFTLSKLYRASVEAFNEVADRLNVLSTRIANFNRSIVMINVS